MNRRSLIILGVLVLTQPAAGQEGANLRGDSAQTRKRLAEAEQKLLAGKHADAADDLQRILDEAGDELITVDGKQYRAARWIAHGILARLPETALKNYQDRIDEPASKLLAAAKRTNDPGPLWQLLDRYYASRPADEGLLFLGDLLFERGEFRAAERTWRRLLPDSGADITYPASRSDPAAVRARIVLAIIFQGDLDRAARELTTFRKRHPGANGPLAGKTGPFAEILQGILENPPGVSPPANPGSSWPAFGAGPDRSGRVLARLSGEWPSKPTWTQEFKSGERHDRATTGPPQRPPFSHPVVLREHVFVTDGSRILGFHLLTGREIHTLELVSNAAPLNERTPPPEPCPTLSAVDDRLYVRIGPAAIQSATGKKENLTAIACVRVVPKADGSCTLKEQWRLKPPVTEDGVTTVWEGAPTVADRRMWVAYARFEGGRIVHGIACYDPNDASSAPDRPAWTADVCDGPVMGNVGRARHELLTLAGRHIVFCSNTGAVVALDASSGRRAWGFRYPRSHQADSAYSPHPTPVVSSGDRLFVSPADGDGVYALDPESGRVLWQMAPATGSRILGVSAGRLIVTVDGPARSIRGLSLETGSFELPNGWIQPGIPGFGQGFVTDDAIVWPTRSGLLLLDTLDGAPLHESRPSPEFDGNSNYFGNVVYSDGVLVVVGHSKVWGYVSHAREFGPPSPRSDRDPARVEFERLIHRSEQALARGEPAIARRWLADAARGPLPKQYRAWTAARLLLLTPRTGVVPTLPPEVEAVLTPELRDEWLLGPDRTPITLGALVDRHLGRGDPHRASSFVQRHCHGEQADVPVLNPDAGIVRTLRLPPGSAPLRWIPGSTAQPTRLFMTTDNELVAVSVAHGEVARFASPDRFTFAAELAEGFIAAGPTAVAVYGTEPTPRWVFRVPTTEPLPARPGMPFIFFGDDPNVPTLASFHLNGTWLIARLGERHLIALDLSGNRIVWVVSSDGTPGFHPIALPSTVRFGPSFGITSRHLLVQLSDGRRRLMDAETGMVSASSGTVERTSRVWWHHRPLELTANTVVIPDGAGLVRLVDVKVGVEKWKHDVEGESSLTGDPPQVAAWPDTLVLAARRNHGVELDRLDFLDGRSLWTGGAAFLDAGEVNLAHAAADSERIIMPVGDSLVAVSLESGKILWKANLPETHSDRGWVVRLGRGCVITYPEAAVPREPVASVLGRLRRSFVNEPALWRLPRFLAGAYDAWVARTVPLVILDPENGERLVRFDIPATGPAVTACFGRDAAVIATGNRVVWLR